jgi:calreticulin
MKLAAVFLLALFAISNAKIYFQESFDSGNLDAWVQSTNKVAEGSAGKFEVSHGKYYNDAEKDLGMRTAEDYRFYTISKEMDTEFNNKDKTFVFQYSVKHENNLDCGGMYFKLLPAGLDQKEFNGDSNYNIMFGPDICGSSTRRIHVIFEHEGKNHLIKKTIDAETDDLTHLYTLIVRPDNTYEVRVDGKEKAKGSLEEDWDMLPAKEILDPNASKPSEWDDRKEIPDESDVKPADFDDIPKEITDPDATKPDDWDEELDGDWEAPTIPNPEFKGEWKQRMITNPAYSGVWVHPKIANPEFKPNPSLYAYESFKYVGLEVWQVKSGAIFDNIIITDSVEEAEEIAKLTLEGTQVGEKKMKEVVQEEERKKAEEERKQREAEEAAAKENETPEEADSHDDDDKDEL